MLLQTNLIQEREVGGKDVLWRLTRENLNQQVHDAFGDDRISDIDVELYRYNGSDWVLVKKDNDSSSRAVVSYTPSTTARFKVVVKAYSFKSGYSVGHYGLIFCHD